MTSIFQIDENNDMWQMLPGGVYILARHQYSQAEVEGITVKIMVYYSKIYAYA